jgi:hypothetical protein
MLPHNCFYLDADGAASAQDALFGYAVLDDGIVVGSDGLAAWRRDNPGRSFPGRDGRFACILREAIAPTAASSGAQGGCPEVLRIRTDVTGQDIVFHYVEAGFWAVSNSFALLAARLSRKRRVRLYEPAAVAFHLKGGVHMGEQLTSFRTLVEGVEILPATSEVVVDLATGRARVEDRSIDEVFAIEAADYEGVLTGFIARAQGTMAALARTAPGIQCQLSGGYDSRLVLALLMGQEPDIARRGGFAVQSMPEKPDDFRVASRICDRYGLPLNVPTPSFRMLSGSEALRVWDLSCLGVYLPFYPVQALKPRIGAHLRLTGDTATSWDHFHGTGPMNGDSAKVERDMARLLDGRPHVDTILADYRAAFDRVGIDRAGPGAMELFYNLFRSRAHCGRHWYRELGQVRLCSPLIHSDMVRLDLLACREGWDRRKVYCDALSATNRELLRMPFETERKSFPEELIAASPFATAPPVRPAPMRVWGTWDAPDPEPDLFLPFLPMRCETEDFLASVRFRFGQIDRGTLGRVFTPADIDKARDELAAPVSMSHGLRKVAHAFGVAAVTTLEAASAPLATAAAASPATHPVGGS